MGQLSVQSEAKGSTMVVTINGRIDSDSAPILDAELTKAVGGNPKLVLDMQSMEYMSSAGIRAVVKVSQAAEKNGGAVKIASAPDSVQALLYTVGLNQKIGLFATIDEAVASF